MNKKGILIGQVLAFIIAGIIFILIIGFGYKAVTDLVQSSSDITVAELKSDLEAAVDSTKRSYGSVRKIELRTPNDVRELCFFDAKKCGEGKMPFDVKSFEGNSLAWAASACNAKSANVFSVPRRVEIAMNEIRIESGYVCVPNVNGLVTIKLTGKGDSVKVHRWDIGE